MQDIPSKPSTESTDIDTPSNNPDVFLDMTGVATKISPNTDLEGSYALLKLAQQFDRKAIELRVIHRHNFLAEVDPWAVIKKASDDDDLALARICLSHADYKRFDTHYFWTRLGQLRSDWQVPILRRLAPDGPPSSIYTEDAPSSKARIQACRYEGSHFLGRHRSCIREQLSR